MSIPIVQGVTPWQARRITSGSISADWPADVDAQRLQSYTDYRNLIENRPEIPFVDRLGLRPDQISRIVLAAALPELVCNVWADGLYGENSPDVQFASDDVRETWDAIWEDNGGDDVLGWEDVFTAAAMGTIVDHVYRDEEDRIRIESIPPGIFFPKPKRGTTREIETVTLAWEQDVEKGKPLQVRKDYAVIGDQLTIVTRQREVGAQNWLVIDELRPEGVDFLPFVDMHAKRWVGRYWGVSELARNMSIFAEIDATLSRIGSVLEYHGEPLLQVPASTLFGGVLPKGADRVVGIRNPSDAEIARYIDLPGHVADQIAEIEKLLDLVLLTSEIQRTYVGLTDQGAPSGTSLRLMLQGYVKKVGRWQRKDKARILALSDMALRLAGVDDEAARAANYIAGSPLPVDDEQEVRILSAMLADGTISRKTYMEQTRRFDDVDAEIARIDAEQQTTAPSGFGLPPGVPTTTAPTTTTIGAPPETTAGG